MIPDRIVLVGFMASGKSTVGPILAGRLGYRFVDLDAEVERRAGATVAEIFRSEGEARFRTLEEEATAELDAAERIVVAAGGGWMARPELRDRWPDAVRVWLRVRPRTVLERVGDAVAERPLLDPGDPEGSAARLLKAREWAYARAELSLDTDARRPEDIARSAHRALLRLARGPSASEPLATLPLTTESAGQKRRERRGTRVVDRRNEDRQIEDGEP